MKRPIFSPFARLILIALLAGAAFCAGMAAALTVARAQQATGGHGRLAICDTPSQAERMTKLVSNYDNWSAAAATVNLEDGSKVCGLSIIQYVEEGDIKSVPAGSKLYIIKRVTVFSVYSPRLHEWVTPPPVAQTQYMPFRVQGFGI